jgi:two-component system sensor histidine kinase UhpB
MWKKLSLRTRLFLPLGLMFIAVLLAGGVALQMLAPIHLMDEHEPTELSTKAVANALNSALHTSVNPQAALDAFVQALGTSEAIHFRAADKPASVHPPIEVQTPPRRVPRWFAELIGARATGTSFPVTVGEKRVGDIVFVPDLSADLFEKWIVFLAMACSAIAFLVLTGVIAYFSAGAAIRPLRNLGEGLTRMREGITPTRSPRPGHWRSGGVAWKPTNSPAPCTG